VKYKWLFTPATVLLGCLTETPTETPEESTVLSINSLSGLVFSCSRKGYKIVKGNGG
jgi:hypothetical protein